ncbi:acyl-CoA dehydrogenase family protein [Sorangium sp. So ce131]|uniref:acyl-CoA dehydrogenase family protein n=1 Tax=Sorangium sp. So ce131 TaxID=3133282 RepID=UPI003F6108D2
MRHHLTREQAEALDEFQSFADREIVPLGDDHHRQQRTRPEIIRRLAERGYLGLPLPRELGGGGRDMVTFGLLVGEVGRGCSSLRSLLTVHTMVAQSILRWGTRAQKEVWIPRLASGMAIAALGLSEPGTGSDAKSVKTEATPDGGDFVLHGHKKWITYGQLADVLLVFARCEGEPAAFLVERERAGVSIEPIEGLLGLRGSMTASVHFDGCRIPDENLVGRRGLGISHVAAAALDSGRYSVAWGSVGLLQACLDACVVYTSEREQFGVRLKEHQLVRRLVTDMITNLSAARLLCLEAGRLRDARDPGALAATSIAKYFASTAAARAADDAVQLHGANGCSSDYPLQRYLGDAKIGEIIEGSSQIQQITIAEYGYQEYGALRSRAGQSSGAAGV